MCAWVGGCIAGALVGACHWLWEAQEVKDRKKIINIQKVIRGYNRCNSSD